MDTSCTNISKNIGVYKKYYLYLRVFSLQYKKNHYVINLRHDNII